MNSNPPIKFKLRLIDLILEVVGWLALLAIWILVLVNYAALPEIITTHFNTKGEADGIGSKINLFSLPIIASLLFIGLTLLNKYPQIFNYATTIHADNALQQYTMATRLLRILKLVIAFIFGAIVFKTIELAKGTSLGLGIWFLPIILSLIFIPVIYFIFKSSQAK